MGKNAKLRISTFFLTTAYLRKPVQNFSKLYRKLILIWAFRKSTFETDTKKSWFFGCVSQAVEPKKIFFKLSSWDFFYFKTSTIILYENIYN